MKATTGFWQQIKTHSFGRSVLLSMVSAAVGILGCRDLLAKYQDLVQHRGG
jgi:hypothetical protein